TDHASLAHILSTAKRQVNPTPVPPLQLAQPGVNGQPMGPLVNGEALQQGKRRWVMNTELTPAADGTVDDGLGTGKKRKMSSPSHPTSTGGSEGSQGDI
ncbi:unnamed protein product, partial [Cyprideis torosa]